MKFKTMMKIMAIKIIWLCSKILCIFPINRNKIFFSSYDGEQYSDSPKYISDYYLNTKDLIVVWGFNKDFDLGKTKINDKIIVCKKGSIEYIYHLFTSKEIVINDFISTAFKLREKQILLNTWHGGGTFKTIGMTRREVSDYDIFFYHAHANNTTAFCLSSEYFEETVVRKSFLFFGEVLKSGMPRNAILFHDRKNIRSKVCKYFHIEQINPILIVLYAPTYRDYDVSTDMYSNEEIIDFDQCRKAFEMKFKTQVYILNRSHHLMKKKDMEGEFCEATDYPDMQELLMAADVLISDYSSCMWDFAITGKPIFLYAPDLKIYEQCIDFFMPVKEWAFPLAFNNDDLVNNIASFDNRLYREELERYMKPLGSYEGKDAVTMVCKWLDRKRME